MGTANTDRFASCVAVAVVLLVAPLYVAARLAAPPDTAFGGIISPWPEDVSYHLSWPRQAADGDLLFEDKFNGARASTPLIFNWYFLLLGLAARAFATDPVYAWYAAQVAWVFVVCRLTSRLGGRFFTGATERRAYVLLALFGGGAGWLTRVGSAFTGLPAIDFHSVEAVPFNWLAREIVVPPTMALSLGIVLRYLDHIDGRRPAWPALPLLFLLLAYVHPHDCLPLALTLVLVEAIRCARRRSEIGRSARLLAGVAGSLILPGLHYLAVLRQDPHLWAYVGLRDQYTALAVCLAYLPHILGGALALGFRATGGPSLLVPVAWAGISAGLLLTPVTLGRQHYLLHGLPFALSVVAVEGGRRLLGSEWWRGLGSRRVRRCFAVFPALAAGTSVALYAQDVGRVAFGYAPWYVPRTHLEAFEWLREHGRRRETAVATPSIGHHLVRYVGLRVAVVQPEQTAQYAERRARQEAWLRGDPAARDFPREAGATLAVFAHADVGNRPALPPLPPGWAADLTFRNEGVTVHRIGPRP